MKNKKIIKDFTVGSIPKQLLLFSIPFMLTNSMQVLYSFVDMAVVGNVLGSEGLSAISTAGQIVTLTTMLCLGFCTGGQVYISQLIGAGRHDELKNAMGTLFTLTAAFGVIVSLACVCFRGWLLRLLSTPEEAFEMAKTYLLICGAGVIFTYGYNVVASILRGVGDSRHPLIFIAIASGINLALDLLFVSVFRWGSAGAAAATVIGQAVSFIVSVIFMKRNSAEFGFNFDLKSFIPHKQTVKVLFRLGIPFALRSGAVNVSMMFVTSLVNSVSVAASAVFGVGLKVDDIVNKISQGITYAVSAIVGQNVAANKISRAKKSIGYAWLYSVLIYSIFTVAYLKYPTQIFSIFTDDQGVIELAPLFVSALVWSFPAMIAMRGSNGFIQGIGNSALSFFLALFDGIVVRIGLSYLLGVVFDMGLYGFFLGYGLACYASAVPGVIYFFSGIWKKRAQRVASLGTKAE